MIRHCDNIQRYINIIVREGRGDELIDISDFYHRKFESIEDAIEFSLNLGQYIGHYHFDVDLWRFKFPDSDVTVYFIGDEQFVNNKIENTL